MMHRFFSKKKILPSLLSGFLVLTFILAPVSHTLEVKNAQAFPVEEVGPNLVTNTKTTIESTISSVANSFSAGALKMLGIKEFALDTIAWGLVNIMIKEMIRSTTKWVNSGFKGNPSFVTNLKGFLTDTADKAAGNFIWGNKDLKFLCSPFKLDIQLALDMQYRETRNYEAQCTLTGIKGNLKGFFKGDFLAGGWNGWYKMTQTPQNNPYGAMLEAQGALTLKIAGDQSKEIKLLDFGKGFLSKQECKFKPTDFEVPTDCKTVTPGTTIEASLNKALGSSVDRLTVADELNELIGALLSQLASSIFGAVGGLLGSTGSGGGSSGGSIFDRIDREIDPSDSGLGDSAVGPALDQEKSYRDILQEIVTLIESARTYREDIYPDARIGSQCYESGTLSASLVQILTENQIELNASEATIADLTELQTDYTTLNNSASEASVITALLVKYDASSTPAAKAKVMNRFMSYQSSGMLHSTVEVGRLQGEALPAIQEEVKTFKSSVDQACSRNNGA